jgi:hypothetical protein
MHEQRLNPLRLEVMVHLPCTSPSCCLTLHICRMPLCYLVAQLSDYGP